MFAFGKKKKFWVGPAAAFDKIWENCFQQFPPDQARCLYWNQVNGLRNIWHCLDICPPVIVQICFVFNLSSDIFSTEALAFQGLWPHLTLYMFIYSVDSSTQPEDLSNL